MNPSSSERGSPNLPPAPKAPEQLPTELTPKPGPSKEAAQEAAPAAPEQNLATLPPTTALPPLPLPPSPPPAADPQAPTQADDNGTTQLAVPDIADDRDLIEKEWVHKAKQIVERTREDPYQQSKEITSFRADYMKKRYNKIIKIE